MNIYLDLFLTFAKIGATTFGGGYAMLPMLKKDVVAKKKWATEEEIIDYFAIAQCTPGVVAVNTATFIGYKYKGVGGAIAATLGVIFPSIIIITIIAAFLQQIATLEIVQNAFKGIRLAVCGTVTCTIIGTARKSFVDMLSAVIGLAAFVAVAFFGAPTVPCVVIFAVFGLAVQTIKAHVKTKRGEEK